MTAPLIPYTHAPVPGDTHRWCRHCGTSQEQLYQIEGWHPAVLTCRPCHEADDQEPSRRDVIRGERRRITQDRLDAGRAARLADWESRPCDCCGAGGPRSDDGGRILAGMEGPRVPKLCKECMRRLIEEEREERDRP